MKDKLLHGLTVVDCSTGLAGPQAAGLLSDYGATVIWVEPKGGDSARLANPAAAAVFNRGKQSIQLDPADRDDRAVIWALAKNADVFVESWPTGFAEKVGLGRDDLKALNPGLVYCSLSGFGREGRHSAAPAYESVVHALLGTMAMQPGHREGPVFQGIPFASVGAAQLAVIGILASLYKRLEDGHGRMVETSLFDGALAYHSMLWGESDAKNAKEAAAGAKKAAGPGAATARLIARTFVCADDKFLGVHTAARGAFGRLMCALGLDDRISVDATGNDLDTPLSEEQQVYLEENIHRIFASKPRAYWVERLIEADVCAVEHRQPTEVFDSPQAQHNGMVVRLVDPVLGPIQQVAPGIRFDGIEALPLKPAPVSDADAQMIRDFSATRTGPSAWRPKASASSERTDTPLLDGVKIVDVGAFYAGPFSSRLLADLGAEVVKIEPIAGDQLRGLERPFFAAQAGKRSLSVNMKDPKIVPAIRKLVGDADILHHNMRPGVAERLGIGFDQVREINPKIIYLYAPGWGASGPHSKRQSFAPMLAAYVGASFEVAGEYNEPLPSLGNEDPGNGLVGAIGILLSLLRRRVWKTVSYCENPQLNAAMGMMSHIVRKETGEVVGAGRLDVMQTGTDALDSLYETKDGWICLTAMTDGEIAAVESVLALDILADSRFATSDLRALNRIALTDLIRHSIETQSTAEILRAFKEIGSPYCAVEPAGNSCVHDLMMDQEARQMGRIAETSHHRLGAVREIDQLIRISDVETPLHRLAPSLGEHSEEILSALGYTAIEIEGLISAGSVRTA